MSKTEKKRKDPVAKGCTVAIEPFITRLEKLYLGNPNHLDRYRLSHEEVFSNLLSKLAQASDLLQKGLFADDRTAQRLGKELTKGFDISSATPYFLKKYKASILYTFQSSLAQAAMEIIFLARTDKVDALYFEPYFEEHRFYTIPGSQLQNALAEVVHNVCAHKLNQTQLPRLINNGEWFSAYDKQAALATAFTQIANIIESTGECCFMRHLRMAFVYDLRNLAKEEEEEAALAAKSILDR